MSTKRKRTPKRRLQTPAAAIEALYWRGKVACEILDGLELPIQAQGPVSRFLLAVADYEASVRAATIPASPERNL